MAVEDKESECLSIDSFSHSWLISAGPVEISSSLRSSIDEGPSSFIEMDPRLPASKRFNSCNFHFPDHSSPAPLLHADDLFHNGQIRPHKLNRSATGRDGFDAGYSVGSPSCLTASARGEVGSLKRCRTVSRSVFRKYLSCLRPFFFQRRATSSKVAWMASPDATPLPRMSIASCSVDDSPWRESCGSESSIDEAVLHCKRSFSK
uniref:Membrane-associated kinase regulator 6 n=1 Tax=Kalanchoe fedtschenkoi TaxID=63787 RepID=A0A7N0U5K7_KALFE